MAIYWVDPYINSPSGGIHGTVNGTTRDGSYSYPLSFDDIAQTSRLQFNINGNMPTALTDNDEVRLKGMALSDFLFNTGTTDNKITSEGTGTGSWSNIDSLRMLHNDSADQTAVASYRSALSALNKGRIGWMVHYDSAMNNDDGRKFRFSQYDLTNSASDGSNTHIGGTYAPLHMYLLANKGGSWQSSFIDTDYILYDVARHTGTIYALQFASNSLNNVTFTDGWTSETARDGLTILCIDSNGSGNNSLFDSGGYYNDSSTEIRFHYDLANTYFLFFDRDDYRTTRKTYITFGITPENLTHKLGGYSTSSSSYYDYIRGQGGSTVSENRVFEIGLIQATRARFDGYGITWKLKDVECEWGVRLEQNRPQTLIVGSIMSRQTAGGNSLIYWRYGASNMKTVFLDDAALYNYQNAPYVVSRNSVEYNVNAPPINGDSPSWPYTGSLLFGGNVSPSLGGAATPNRYLYGNSDNSDVAGYTATPASFMDAIAFLTSGDSNVAGFVNDSDSNAVATFPLLEMNGQNYKQTDLNVTVAPKLSKPSDAFGQPVIVFARNDYDGRPIGFMLEYNTSNPSKGVPFYNDADKNDALCIQSVPITATSIRYYRFSFIEGLPAGATSNSYTVVIEIEGTDDTALSGKTVRMSYVKTDGTSDVAEYVVSHGTKTDTDDGTRLSTTTINLTDVDPSFNSFAFTFKHDARSSDTYAKKVWIKNVSITEV